MKIRNQLEKILILLLLGAVTGTNVLGQNSYINGRLNIKTGYARYNTGSFLNDKQISIGNYRIEANYGLTNFIEAGVYLGGSRSLYYRPHSFDKDNFVPYYGVNINYHLLPYWIKAENFRFDLYLSGKFGGLLFKDKWSGDSFHRVEYALGTGACFYLWKHVGLYSEYCYGNYLFSEDSFIAHTKFRYGLTLKF